MAQFGGLRSLWRGFRIWCIVGRVCVGLVVVFWCVYGGCVLNIRVVLGC